jgi:MFS transporter, OFA family, oxalate/formate antiporter
LVLASGLIATAQIAPIASDFGVANTLVLLGGTTLTVALIAVGREYTMTIAFSLGRSLGTAPWAFVMFAAVIFLTWGEIFSLFRPAPIHSGRNS